MSDSDDWENFDVDDLKAAIPSDEEDEKPAAASGWNEEEEADELERKETAAPKQKPGTPVLIVNLTKYTNGKVTVLPLSGERTIEVNDAEEKSIAIAKIEESLNDASNLEIAMDELVQTKAAELTDSSNWKKRLDAIRDQAHSDFKSGTDKDWQFWTPVFPPKKK